MVNLNYGGLLTGKPAPMNPKPVNAKPVNPQPAVERPIPAGSSYAPPVSPALPPSQTMPWAPGRGFPGGPPIRDQPVRENEFEMGRGFPGGPPIGGQPVRGNKYMPGRGIPGGPPTTPTLDAGRRGGAVREMRDSLFGKRRPPMRRPYVPGQAQAGGWRAGSRPPPMTRPYRPGGRPLNDQQQQMRTMPAGMRQAYNNRPMTRQEPMPPPVQPQTQRGKPAASRVNLQGNQLNRWRY